MSGLHLEIKHEESFTVEHEGEILEIFLDRVTNSLCKVTANGPRSFRIRRVVKTSSPSLQKQVKLV